MRQFKLDVEGQGPWDDEDWDAERFIDQFIHGDINRDEEGNQRILDAAVQIVIGEDMLRQGRTPQEIEHLFKYHDYDVEISHENCEDGIGVGITFNKLCSNTEDGGGAVPLGLHETPPSAFSQN